MADATKDVAISLGTHTWSPGDEKVDRIVASMRKHGLKVLDTARVYGWGASENAIGERKLAKEFSIDTKANTALVPGSARNIAKEASESWEALQTNKVRVYFLHGPDVDVPFGEQMEVIQKIYLRGHFEEFGLSNFTREQTLEIYNYAKSKGYVLPTRYQAGYSLADRLSESELFPTLRDLGISLQAYSPMSMGFLAKTPEYIEQGLGMWDPNDSFGRQLLDSWYHPEFMELLRHLERLSEDTGLSRASLAYRWVRYHSALKGELGDEMIVGGTDAGQVEDALDLLRKGPLEEDVVQRIDALWEIVKPIAKLNHVDSARKMWSGSHT